MLVVEHDPDVIQTADHVIDIGPNAGKDGGEIMFEEHMMAYFNLKRARVKL